MAALQIQIATTFRLDDIYRYTRDKWGEAQADRYINGWFETFANIAPSQANWRPIPAEFGGVGYFCKYERHFIYWKHLSNGDIGIVTFLQERVHQIDSFRGDSGTIATP